MKSILTLTLLISLSFTAFAQHEDHGNHQQEEQHQHTDHLDTLILHYMEAKNALVQDNFGSAKEHLQAFSKEVHGSGEMNNHQEHTEKHAAHHSKMEASVQEATESKDIKALRAAFKKISDELITAVQNQGYEGKLFKQYCPMFEDGSNWLSSKEEIQNPFFGQAMHSCGDSSELIHKDSDEL